MPAKYKDYPIYTYDEPVTYSDFSGGINTDPSNEHLLANEMRDCLNMHYKSAALVKRKGASLLCTISCEDELFNIQGVFLFTYRTTYIIIAADGKLYQGIYAPNSKTILKRLHINIPVLDSDDAYNALDVSVGLPQYIEELTTTENHEGFIHKYLFDSNGVKQSLTGIENFDDFFNLPDNTTLPANSITSFKNKLYRSKQKVTKQNRLPSENTSTLWLTLDNYNTKYSQQIFSKTDPIHLALTQNYMNASMKINDGGLWEVDTSLGAPSEWSNKTYEYKPGQVVLDTGIYYVCITQHASCTGSPLEDNLWVLATERQELVFQNYLEVEAATYNNKLYIATGTRFIEISLVSDELQANVVMPYQCTSNEVINIGYNYLSPYPEICLETRYNQAITSISQLLVIPQKGGEFLLQPLMTFANNETAKDYYFKWEKKENDEWITIRSYKNNMISESSKGDYSKLFVSDADKCQYRVSFAKSFERPVATSGGWSYDTAKYNVGDIVSVQESIDSKPKLYQCLIAHSPKQHIWYGVTYKKQIVTDNNVEGRIVKTYAVDAYGNYSPDVTPTFSTHTKTIKGYEEYEIVDGAEKFLGYRQYDHIIQNGQIFWQEILPEDTILAYDDSGNIVTQGDWKIDKVDGEYFGQATSVLYLKQEVNTKFELIHSCRKITADGNKFLLYGDRYNSGSWFKTIINNPAYITDRGGLSFKTTKNEELLKVVPFNGVLLAFANSENIGGSIHLITGNGDDWDDQSGYYSPYRRVTINNSISCDNAKTIQICENLIVFKYFDTVYYIESSELSQEVVTIHSCNDRLKHLEASVVIPWDDNSCISEVTEDYYALIWKEKFYIENGELIQERPGLKLKMYYKMGYQPPNSNKVLFPWLRDESDYFNVDYIIYLKGKPVYLYNNTLISFNENIYTDFGKIYKCMIHFRGEDIGYPKVYKLISNILVYYHRTQSSQIDFNLLVNNEAGHTLIDSTSKRISLQDLKVLRSGDTIDSTKLRLDSTILDSKVFNTTYKFPCLIADSIIYSYNDKEFSLSSLTYNYTTCDTPDTTAYDLYTNIIRMKEVK